MAGTVKVYYCKQTETPTEDHRLIPAPTISINPEIYYANDSIVGYNYTVDLNGYATAKESTNQLLEGSLDQVEFVRGVFNVNGGNLYVKDQDDNDLIVCKGATIRGMVFDQSPNYGLNYIPYTVNIEFNEVNFPGCNSNPGVDCTSSLFHLNQTSQNITTDNLVDIETYKIKEFSDSWNFTIDNEIYKAYYGGNNSNNTENNTFKVQYQIQATGKNYYVDDTLVPAWHQARSFVQDRLYKQVKGLITGVETLEAGDFRNGCNTSRTANELYDVVKGSGILDGFNTIPDVDFSKSLNTEIYDETISCETSESAGTFSVTYSAVIKRGSYIYQQYNAASHSYTVAHDYSKDNSGSKEVTINVRGTVRGLIRGGYIHYNSRFELPQNGSFIVNVNSTEDRFYNARQYFAQNIGFDNDLSDNMKNIADVNYTSLLVSGNTGYPPPQTFVLDYNYAEGTIGYTATYTTSHAKFNLNGFTTMSIVRKDPVLKIQEFVIPGRSQGPIVQDLGMYTPRTISVSMEGYRQEPGCMPTSACSLYGQLPGGLNTLVQQANNNQGWVISKNTFNSNWVDGSYSLNLELTCIS